MADRDSFEFEGLVTPAEEIAEVLERIGEALRVRSLSVSMGAAPVTVCPEGDLELRVDASEKKGKVKLEIVIAWRLAKGAP
jgi:amphi-Trp domain-containing protein